MNVAKLKEIIKDLPDEMPVGLLDMSTDDFDDANYALEPESFSIEDCCTEQDGEPIGKMLIISFDNKLNPHPLPSN